MNFSDRPGKSAVERFMQYFFLQAKVVGNLTGVFLAHLDEQFAVRKRARAARRRSRARTRNGEGLPRRAAAAGGAGERLVRSRTRCG